jgi:hypothetical protein
METGRRNLHRRPRPGSYRLRDHVSLAIRKVSATEVRPMRSVILFLAAVGAGWAAVHESMRYVCQGTGLAQPSLLFGLVASPAGLIGAFVGVALLGLLLPPAR